MEFDYSFPTYTILNYVDLVNKQKNISYMLFKKHYNVDS